jgi:hypothetical protein
MALEPCLSWIFRTASLMLVTEILIQVAGETAVRCARSVARHTGWWHHRAVACYSAAPVFLGGWARHTYRYFSSLDGTTRSRVSFFMNGFRKLGFIHYNGGLQVHSSQPPSIKKTKLSLGHVFSSNSLIRQRSPGRFGAAPLAAPSSDVARERSHSELHTSPTQPWNEA